MKVQIIIEERLLSKKKWNRILILSSNYGKYAYTCISYTTNRKQKKPIMLTQPSSWQTEITFV